MIRFTKEKATGRIHKVREETKTFRPDDIWPEMWNFMSCTAKMKAKQIWPQQYHTIERDTFLIELNDEKFELTNDSRS